MTMRALSVFGTRPEAIKMAPVVKALENSKNIESLVCVTAQHRDMLDQVLSLFDLTPDYDLNLMKPKQTLHGLTSDILINITEVLQHVKPDIVLVHGDTSTCFTAALASFYLQIPIAHVEAGLRTGNFLEPFPEEANRAMVGRLATMHFAPTESAKQNLLDEGIPDNSIELTGNTVIDALGITKERVTASYDSNHWINLLGNDLYSRIIDKGTKTILVTGHRRENFGSGMENICHALKSLALSNQSWTVVYPVHLNPNVKVPVEESLGELTNIHLIDPLEYDAFVWMMEQSDVVLTDSGGIQEEAPHLGKPVFVMRDRTERPEAVAAGTVKLVGTDSSQIVESVAHVLADDEAYELMAQARNPYGDGRAAERIVDSLLAWNRSP